MAINLIARSSQLSRLQVVEFVSALSNSTETIDLDFNTKWAETPGDRDKKTSLTAQNLPVDFFTKDLDEAVLNADADISIHSAKDLPFPLAPGLIVGALLAPAARGDSLVSRNGLTLEQLPAGAIVGTSSHSRKSQLLELRPDVKAKDIRGTIEERIKQCEDGTFDAVIIASCALDRLGLQNKRSQELPFKTHPLQGYLAAVIRKDDIKSRQLLWNVDHRRQLGTVYLSGAGPGGIENMTQAALSAVRNADVLIYDDLADPEILDENPTAIKLYVGKRKGSHYASQDDINELMYNHALSGETVCRLKGGDPLIYGRAGEEADYLRSRMIRTEIIPGISSSQLAAAENKLALTYRNRSPRFITQSGHRALELQDGIDTLALYMGASKKEDMRDHLLNQGYDPEAPVLLARSVGRLNGTSEFTTVQNLAESKAESPLMMLTGGSIHHSGSQLKYLYTGTNRFRIHSPYGLVSWSLIKQEHVYNVQLPDENGYDAVIFTSRQAVHLFVRRFGRPDKKAVIALGKSTAFELKKSGVKVHHVAAYPEADAVSKFIESKTQALAYQAFLYPCSALSANSIQKNKKVISFPFYTSVPLAKKVPDFSLFDGIVFTSPSTVDAFFALEASVDFTHLHVLAMGRVTKSRLHEKGVKNVQTL